MDAELKDKWVKALRSGEYKQGYGQLHNTDDGSYCCLGVLNAVRQVPQQYDFHELGLFSGPYIAMNDREHKDFSQIADYIEENL